MEKDWILEMEKIRSPNSPIGKYSLKKLSRGSKSKIRDHLKTFRCHLFYILEMLIEAIDINDVDKASIAIQGAAKVLATINMIVKTVKSIDS
nr:unnamed protein product [Haemonchus contortus]